MIEARGLLTRSLCVGKEGRSFVTVSGLIDGDAAQDGSNGTSLVKPYGPTSIILADDPRKPSPIKKNAFVGRQQLQCLSLCTRLD